MEIQNTEIQQYVVRYTATEGDHSFTDALYFTPDEWAAATPESIAAEQQRRFQNWLAVVTAPAHVPTAEEQAAQLEALRQQQEMLTAQIAALTPQGE